MMRFLSMLALLVCSCVHADTIVLSDDGREVRLMSDGTWEFVSEDRYATTREGERVRLKSDGRWESVDDEQQWVAVPTEQLSRRWDQVSVGDLDLEVAANSLGSHRALTLRKPMSAVTEDNPAALTTF